ncbi:hypothetical protein BDN71DRAFT_1512229 [Pleurotus eryngii]|uniref:CxC5 like cysteine cluster associated with KDZ domain-containing protein n=1 Tax=Pleurotus eryngii TaxID=5323 RepID=A0A9P6DB89_PLEER|nr:hypothetical protein BDN71DRAFT_1512229 [Pleurotus eryngii]
MLFTEFAQSIQDNFGPKIKLSTVSMLLITLQVSQQQESTSWMAALVHAVKAKLSENGFSSLFTAEDLRTSQFQQQQIIIGNFESKLCPISTVSVQPIILITSIVMACPTLDCNNHGLTQDLQEHNISHVTLLQGNHKWFTQNNVDDLCLYLNNAKYLKVGKRVWVNHIVSEAIVNVNYNFHTSTATITEFWNFSFVKDSGGTFKLGHCQVWKAFVEESIQQMAKFNKCQIVFEGNLSINALVAATYIELGDNGVIHSAEGHSCNECCHAFKDVADVIPRQPNNSAAMVGHDENHVVPDYEGPAPNPDTMEVNNNPAAVVQPAGNIALEQVSYEGLWQG